MFQEFYKDTLAGRYIKSLLAQTPMPVFESVVDGDHIISGCYYVYRRYIIKCHTSGILKVSEMEDLYPSDTLYPSVFLFPAYGYRAATFYVKCITDEYNPKTHSTFISNTNSYDPDTHYQLGRFLRYELTRTGLNLFPFYNCYSGKRLLDVSLSKSRHEVNVSRTSVQKHKLVAIPILFGHSYTIAIDCPTEVLMRAVVYDDSGYLEPDKLPEELVKTLQESGAIYSRLMFSQPVTFRVETDSIKSFMFQKDLYLVIQLPINNDSSIVVLENFDNTHKIYCDEKSIRKYNMINPSLLAMNTRKSFAFSDRLIEYLVGHVIYSDDYITNNISLVQSALSNYSQDYKRSFINKKYKYGIWNDEQSKLLLSLLEDYSTNHNIYDQDGNFNKDALSVISVKGDL